MKYRQLDKITSIEPGKKISAERTLQEDEEYLLDHFPRFPVMPGVMMLEAIHQAAIWMIRSGDDFKYPLILLREVKSVKFGDFLVPGETLQINAEVLKSDGNLTTVKANATKQGRTTVSARLVLERCSCNDPERLNTDQDVSWRAKKQFLEMFGPLLSDGS
ncbi:3-hydroxyacyl-[acyl-carrier-protein] dehydratase FabZ [Novipirellula aureliae]|uniref:3-hydroxyacyl-[acyl-carrier-protein] dehydratase FabZ n=1 Tax=Novipirellula aureliae TaxID=2527966 RepID=A0A5C6DUH8_9BACT|nr:3-hydroxyacyl-ACP dehydratase FabZ family protein [Novipirellula aureliae]TWU40368.1 3-hydroxyacyl-[acyl-carrier-protein] dehydratase FabZ [Novipirellula aureliae]